MENNKSPLEKYKRQPKLYIDLPSKGVWYPKNQLEKAEELEVYSMTANDEINLKTPDALFSGLAVKRLIENCIPGIKDAWYVPVVDLDYILASIRLASYGDEIGLKSLCPKCSNEDSFSLSIQNMLEGLQSARLSYQIDIEGLVFKLRPLTYKELTDFQRTMFQLRRTLVQSIANMPDGDEKDKQADEVLAKMRTLTIETMCLSVTEIVTPEGESEKNTKFISDFIINSGDKEYYNALQYLYEQNQKALQVTEADVACSSCGHEYKLSPDLDYSSFFVRN